MSALPADAPVIPLHAVRPRRHLVAVPETARPSAAPAASAGGLRPTRRGRLVVTAMVSLLATGTAAAVAAPGGSEGGSAPVIEVTSGQTLSDIAARELPQLPIAEGVARLQASNNLASSHVHAGQTLVIPAP